MDRVTGYQVIFVFLVVDMPRAQSTFHTTYPCDLWTLLGGDEPIDNKQKLQQMDEVKKEISIFIGK